MQINYDNTNELFYHENKVMRKNFSKLICGRKGSVIDIPCASGMRLSKLSEVYDSVYAFDISSNMISYAQNKFKNLSNISFDTLDIKEISKVKNKVDDLFILEYAIQFLTLEELNSFCAVLNGISNTVFLEVFDYSKVVNMVEERFYVNNDSVSLKKYYSLENDTITIKKLYTIKEIEYEQILKLYNFSLSTYVTLFEENGFKIKSVYSDYSLNLEKKSPRKILVFEKLEKKMAKG